MQATFVLRLTSKGQATIPKPVRDALRVKPRGSVRLVLEGERAFLIRLRTPREAFGSWRGILSPDADQELLRERESDDGPER